MYRTVTYTKVVSCPAPCGPNVKGLFKKLEEFQTIFVLYIVYLLLGFLA